MHTIGLFSGLRPGNLVAIERAWIRLDRRAISFPAHIMKGRRDFDLPLSTHLVELVRQALQAGDLLHPGSAWLFPTRSHDGRSVKATQVWKEATLPNATGHALRHSYSNLATLARVDSVSRRMLMAQKIPGIEGRYLDEATQFQRLLEDQERVSAYVLGLLCRSAGAGR